MEPELSKYLVGFRRNHNTQHVFLRVIESWRALQNKGQKVDAIIMVLSKAFGTLNDILLFKKNWKLMVLIKYHFLVLKAILLTESKELR